LLEIADVENISLEERAFTVEEAKGADEAFISNATSMVLAVVSIDGVKIKEGRPGPITKRLRSLYEQRVLIEASEEYY
jgi:D-alanine transaminase